MRAWHRVSLILACWMMVTPPALAIQFYSINDRGGDNQVGPHDELVIIESDTGDVTVVGSLGIDAIFPTLTILDDRLFGRTSVTRDGDTLLVEIDRDTGSVLSSVNVTVGGAVPQFAEGIATLNGELVISYKRNISNNSASNSLGALAMDGTVSNLLNFPLSTDLDAVAFDSSGQGFAFNQFAPIDITTHVLRFDPAVPQTTAVGTLNSPQFWGIANTQIDDLYGIERTGLRRLSQLNSNGNPIATVSYAAEFQLIGLAAVPSPIDVIDHFNAGFGVVAIGFDGSTDHVYVKSVVNGATREFASTGEEIFPRIALLGPTDDAAGFDFTSEPVNVGGTNVPADTLLFFNGDPARERIFAIDKDTGARLANVVVADGVPNTNTQSGAYHPGRKSFYVLDWFTDSVRELDPATGEQIGEFSVASHIDIFFGGIDVSLVDGHVFLVSNTKNSIVELESDGTFVRELDLTQTGITDLSSIAIDDKTGDAWLSTLNGDVYRIGGVARAVPEPHSVTLIPLLTVGAFLLRRGKHRLVV